MKLSLLVTVGKAEGKVIAITTPQFVVGRDPQCHLRPASPIISKKHCALIRREGKAFVQDFNSTNGTFVNEQPVKGERELKNDDQLRIGPLTFVVRIEASAPTPVPAAAASDDDDVAAMLLSMGNDSAAGGTDAPPVTSEIPQESTILDLPAVSATGQIQQGNAADKKSDKSKPSGNTQSAAEALLAKYSRRNRK